MTFTDEMVTFIVTGQPPAGAGSTQIDWPAVRAAVDTAADRAPSVAAVAEAYAIGALVADRVATVLDSSPAADRWSRQGVAGVIGAAAALGRLMNFDDQRIRHLLGLCATQATGLKNLDGTETGALQVRKAASDAVEAAVLVSHGFTSSADGLCGRRGLFALMAPGATVSGHFGWAED
jgi:2-methylcitrate dehydratase PrpD